jgi:hypothetical protein
MRVTWSLHERLPSGHRLFVTDGDTRYAIADRSGPDPEHTDDGLLWLDQTRPLQLSDVSFSWLAPLIDPAGRPCATPVDSASAAVLSARYGMVLHSPAGPARAVRHLGRGTSWIANPAGPGPLAVVDLILGEHRPGTVPTLAGWLCQLETRPG